MSRLILRSVAVSGKQILPLRTRDQTGFLFAPRSDVGFMRKAIRADPGRLLRRRPFQEIIRVFLALNALDVTFLPFRDIALRPAGRILNVARIACNGRGGHRIRLRRTRRPEPFGILPGEFIPGFLVHRFRRKGRKIAAFAHHLHAFPNLILFGDRGRILDT